MKTTLTILLVIGSFTIGFSQSNCDKPGKVRVCHIPPGNPDNAHEICVSMKAVAAHLAHGCHIGFCQEVPNKVSDGMIENMESSEEFGSHVSVYPNPFDGAFILDMLFDGRTSVEVNVYDTKGTRVATPFKGNVDGSLKLNWNADELASGMYITKVITPNDVFSQKVNKQF